MGNCFTAAISISTPALSSSSQLSSVMSSSPKRRRFAAAISTIPSLPSSDLSLFYDLGPVLGRGQFGVIRRCVHRASGVAFACKSIPKSCISSPHELADVLREIDIMQLLSAHPHVVRLHHAFQDSAYVHLVMELCEGGELFDRIMAKKRYAELEAAAVMKSLVETVKYCHSMGVMHRDLKPENILLADSSESYGIKLADFGLGLRFSPGDKFSGMAGSAYYIAPEVLQGRYSEEIDIWGAGVILYVLLSGTPPFWSDTDQGTLDAIKKGKLEFFGYPWGKVSRSAKDLIRGMLCSDPKLRLTPTQVLEHPWILRHCQHAQNSQLPRAPRESLSREPISSAASCSEDTRAPQEAVSCASCSPLRSSCVAIVSNVSEGFSSHIQKHRGYDIAIATATSVHPVPEVSSISSISSFSPSLQPEPVENKEVTAQSSTCCATSTDASAQSLKSQAPNVLQTINIEVDFDDFVASLVNGLNSSPFYFSGNFTSIKIDNGCTCTLMRTTDKEQTLLVETRLGKFLIVHDKLRKEIGWKPLQKQRSCLTDSRITKFSRVSDSRPSFQQSQPVF